MIRNIRHLKNSQSILRNRNPLHLFIRIFIIKNQLATRMVLQIVRKRILPILDNIIMTQQIISFEIIRSKDVVTRVFHACQLRKLFA